MLDERAENELLFDLVKTLHGDGLTDEEFAAVSGRVDDVVRAAESLRAVPLKNTDEPFVLFAPLDMRAQR